MQQRVVRRLEPPLGAAASGRPWPSRWKPGSGWCWTAAPSNGLAPGEHPGVLARPESSGRTELSRCVGGTTVRSVTGLYSERTVVLRPASLARARWVHCAASRDSWGSCSVMAGGWAAWPGHQAQRPMSAVRLGEKRAPGESPAPAASRTADRGVGRICVFVAYHVSSSVCLA